MEYRKIIYSAVSRIVLTKWQKNEISTIKAIYILIKLWIKERIN